MTAPPRWDYLMAGDPRLVATRDPARSRASLDGASLRTVAQEQARDRVLELLDHHGAGLADRTTSPGHLTGSALVVDPSNEKILLLLHTKLRRWLQPGGHADGDHELANVALREAAEETGIEGLSVLVPAVDVDVHTVDHRDELGSHLHLDVRFLVVTPPGAQVRANHESLDQRWVDRSELDEVVDEVGIIRLADAGLEALSQHPPGFHTTPSS
ncbi:MAG: NUDIX hydrolase [Microthrixaceae bacterium]